MKITFIVPAVGKMHGKKYIKSWQVMEPLAISTLKSFTPDKYEIEFFDDRIELIDYEIETDLVAITCETFTAYRSYAIAKRFRERGIPVVMGGCHVTSLPGEVAEHADSIVVGNAEFIWEEVLRDAEKGKLKPEYIGRKGYREIVPDRSIYKKKKYSSIGLVETGRGCNFDCNFCSITKCYDGRYYPRKIETIVEDIKASGKKVFFFVDENIVSNQKFAIELCKAITPLKIKWSSQGCLTVAKNPELLSWLKKSGCEVLFIGIDSLNEDNLKQIKKEWSLKMGERDELIKKIHEAGINIYSTFVFGLDHDSPDTFKQTVDFAKRHGFYNAAFNQITPFPGTPFYEQLKDEERLIAENWWLDKKYRYGTLQFNPSNMTGIEVGEMCSYSRREFFKTSMIIKRWLNLWSKNRNLLSSYAFLSSNMKMQRKIDERQELPIGINLDEMPK